MKHRSVNRFLPCLLIALAPLFGHCGGTAEPSTETGNPPVIESRRLQVVLTERGVEVVGSPGAVTPGATVTVTNLSTGESVQTTARADGSLSVAVSGSPDDEYTVTVTSSGGSRTVTITGGSNGSGGSSGANGSGGTNPGATGGSGGSELESASCSSLQDSVRETVTEILDAADRSCQSDADCVNRNVDSDCHRSCAHVALASSTADQTMITVELAVAPLCDEFDRRCTIEPVECPDEVPQPPICNNGACADPGTVISCQELSEEAEARMARLRQEADRTCTEDSDCELFIPTLTCFADCNFGVAVAASAMPGLTASKAQIEQELCTRYEDQACPEPLPLPCKPPQLTPLVCNGGQCALP